MDIKTLKKLEIPASPGCYQFFDEKGEIIYIGKAANLKSRVLSYWQKSADHTPLKEAMVLQVAKLKFIETDSEVEALLLESNLVKKFQPRFNILLRDDKRFAYIKISTDEEWPGIFLTRKLDKAGSFFGPFTSAESVRETLKIIRKIWPYMSCSRLPKRACLYYPLGKCPGICENKIGRPDYLKIIKEITVFLSGGKKRIVSDLKKSIRASEKKLKQANLEPAEKERLEENILALKYKLINLDKVLSHANILSLGDKYVADVVELAKILELPKIPKRIEGYDISNIFGREAVGSMVVFSGGEPDKNEYRKFKIKIGQGLANDIGMLTEILERRFRHAEETLEPGVTEDKALVKWPLPDLIVIDGARAQVNVARKILKKFKLDIPALAISKGDGLRSARARDKIFFAGEKKPLELSLASPALHVIKRVRDEAHRFAINYHRKLRGKSWKTNHITHIT